jgi:hypothetical protein
MGKEGTVLVTSATRDESWLLLQIEHGNHEMGSGRSVAREVMPCRVKHVTLMLLRRWRQSACNADEPHPRLRFRSRFLRVSVDRRVERWRGSLGQAHRFPALYVCWCLTRLAMPRFHLPLIKPNVPN